MLMPEVRQCLQYEKKTLLKSIIFKNESFGGRQCER
jgi:hypothetical protein